MGGGATMPDKTTRHGCSHALLETYSSIGTVLTIVGYSLHSGLSIQPGEALYTEV